MAPTTSAPAASFDETVLTGDDAWLWAALTNDDLIEKAGLDPVRDELRSFKKPGDVGFEDQVFLVARVLQEHYATTGHIEGTMSASFLAGDFDTTLERIEVALEVVGDTQSLDTLWVAIDHLIDDWTDDPTAQGEDQALAIGREIDRAVNQLRSAAQKIITR